MKITRNRLNRIIEGCILALMVEREKKPKGTTPGSEGYYVSGGGYTGGGYGYYDDYDYHDYYDDYDDYDDYDGYDGYGEFDDGGDFGAD